MKVSFSKCEQMTRKLQIWSHGLTKSLKEIVFFVQRKYEKRKSVKTICCYLDISQYAFIHFIVKVASQSQAVKLFSLVKSE